MKNRWTSLRKRACKGNLVMAKVEVYEGASSAQEKSNHGFFWLFVGHVFEANVLIC